MKALLDSILASPISLIIIVLAAIGVLVMSAQVGWLVLGMVKGIRIGRARAAFNKNLNPRLLGVLDDPEGLRLWIAEAGRYPEDVLREAFEGRLNITRGDTARKLGEVYKALGLMDRDVKISRSRFQFRRILAMRRLSVLSSIVDTQVFTNRLGDAPVIRLLAAYGLAKKDDGHGVYGAFKGMKLPWRVMERPVYSVLAQLTTRGWDQLMSHYQDLDEPRLKKILLVEAATRNPESSRDLVELAASDPDTDLRLGAAMAAGHLRSDACRGVLIALLQDGEFEVRAQAALGLEHSRSDLAVEALAEALGDSSFWVRQNAAASLRRMGYLGVERLRVVAETSQDQFAVDTARQELDRVRFLSLAEEGRS